MELSSFPASSVYLKALGFLYSLAARYSPQIYDEVERFNRVKMDGLHARLADDQEFITMLVIHWRHTELYCKVQNGRHLLDS